MSADDVEFVMPSIFTPNDWKKHFSINTETGLWQDFKAGRSGNFIHFYAHVKNISYKKAFSELLFKDLVSEVSGEKEGRPLPREKKITELPNFLDEGEPVHLGSHESSNELILKAWCLLYERKLFNFDIEEIHPFYVATSGRYKNRLIIPFKTPDDDLFYFQARALYDETPKYLNPIDSPVKPSHILYPFDEAAPSVVVCEGPLDALSLQLQGVNATCTLGCSVSETQINMLRNYLGKIIVGYDNDAAGQRGLEKFERMRLEKRMPNLYVCHPPKNSKDWNFAHIHNFDLKDHVDNYTFKYDFDYRLTTSL